jgi:glycosyltransferase involved in cell wall biosynthesis
VRRRPRGVELVGYLGAAVGGGETARRYLGALRVAGIAVRERNVALEGRDSAMTALPLGRRAASRSIGCNLLCLNPEQMVPYLGSPEAPPLRNRVNVGAWAWEVDIVPSGWVEAARRVVEVWACSEFTARLIAAATGARAVGILPPLPTTPLVSSAPAERPRPFRVLSMFDYLSTIQRKNPAGAIEAYRAAFGPEDGAQLIIKSVNGVHRVDARREVELAASGRADISLQDGTVSGEERDALVAGCDCLISMHRSEGFGLSLAEAMSAGKPVIATAYGGNTEFMTAANSYLIGYEPTLVGAGCEHYAATASWAEPDVARAAAALRAIVDDPNEARERAARGQREVNVMLAPARIGAQMRDRLAMLSDAAPDETSDPESVATRT